MSKLATLGLVLGGIVLPAQLYDCTQTVSTQHGAVGGALSACVEKGSA
jgi:hypothetical protein